MNTAKCEAEEVFDEPAEDVEEEEEKAADDEEVGEEAAEEGEGGEEGNLFLTGFLTGARHQVLEHMGGSVVA